MKVSELTGALLDYYVAQAEGKNFVFISVKWDACVDSSILADDEDLYDKKAVFSPSTNWAQGGPIIERERIKLLPTIPTAATWYASIWNGTTLADGVSHRAQADAPLVAAMRAYVASKFGDEVQEVPA